MRKIIYSSIFICLIFSSEVYGATNSPTTDNSRGMGIYPYQDHILGLRGGTITSGISRMGLQGFLDSIQYGFVSLFKFSKYFGIRLDVCYTNFGTMDIPFSLPIAIAKQDTKPKNDDFISNTMEDILNKAEGAILTKKETMLIFDYLTIPISWCLIYKSSNDAFFTNYLSIGVQFGILLKAERYTYGKKTNIQKKSLVDWEWEWIDTENCKKCKEGESLTKELEKFDYGVLLGYTCETSFGLLIGVNYYSALKKLYKKDKNSFRRQRRNFSIEANIGYNFMKLIYLLKN